MGREAYLAFERSSQQKHELWDGSVYARTGASLAHNRIVRNPIRHLRNALEEADVLLNPRTIIGVLSPSTAAFDRGEKFGRYRSMPSVREVVFVSQDARLIGVYTRRSDDSWVLREQADDGAHALEPLTAPVPLRRIYEGVELVPELGQD